MNQNQSSELFVHEWLSVFIVAGFIFMLAASSYQASPSLENQGKNCFHSSENTIEVYVRGCVQNPGAHKFKAGVTVGEVLKEVKTSSNACLDKIDAAAKVRSGQTIKVPAKKTPKASKAKVAKKI